MMQDDSGSQIGQKTLDNPFVIEHVYEPDRDAMVAALRVVLGLPKRLAGDKRCKT